MHGQFSGLIIDDKHGDKHGATLANNLDFCSNERFWSPQNQRIVWVILKNCQITQWKFSSFLQLIYQCFISRLDSPATKKTIKGSFFLVICYAFIKGKAFTPVCSLPFHSSKIRMNCSLRMQNILSENFNECIQ